MKKNKGISSFGFLESEKNKYSSKTALKNLYNRSVNQ